MDKFSRAPAPPSSPARPLERTRVAYRCRAARRPSAAPSAASEVRRSAPYAPATGRCPHRPAPPSSCVPRRRSALPPARYRAASTPRRRRHRPRKGDDPSSSPTMSVRPAPPRQSESRGQTVAGESSPRPVLRRSAQHPQVSRRRRPCPAHATTTGTVPARASCAPRRHLSVILVPASTLCRYHLARPAPPSTCQRPERHPVGMQRPLAGGSGRPGSPPGPTRLPARPVRRHQPVTPFEVQRGGRLRDRTAIPNPRSVSLTLA